MITNTKFVKYTKNPFMQKIIQIANEHTENSLPQ